MPPRGPLPPRPDFTDIPIWEHNYDNVQTRTVNAAWNALFTTELSAISFRSLAMDVGVTAPSLYHYFPSVDSLGGELAARACAMLHHEITELPLHSLPRPKPLKELVERYLDFASKRQRHFSLMFSPQFSDPEAFPRVAEGRLLIVQAIFDLMKVELGGEPTLEDLQIFWGIIHGAAAFVASGMLPLPAHLIVACRRQLEVIRTIDVAAPGPAD